jgi:hypothetical protein
MRRNQQRLLWLGISILGALTLSPALMGQASGDSRADAPVPTDWSHQRVIFSRPGTPEQAARVRREARYWQQLARQAPATLAGAEARGTAVSEVRLEANAALPDSNQSGSNQNLKRDWAQDLGSGGSFGAGSFPAKLTFRGATATCAGGPTPPDFVVYGTGIAGSGTQANIVAYDNLYSGCTGTVPSVYWAYDTGGPLKTSPVFSGDGTQVAFVLSNGPATGGILVLLKWSASTTETVSNPMTLTPVLSAAYPGCTAPCMTQLALRNPGGTPDQDSNSSIFYDYNNDAAYVGDDSGYLHKFSPVFNGVLTEVKTGGWPVQVDPGAPTALSSPVHDSASGEVLVGDVGGFLYWVDGTTGVATQSGQLDFGTGIVDSPMVDSTTGIVYVFVSSDGSQGCAVGVTKYNCSVVFQFNTGFVSGDVGSRAIVGTSTVTGTMPNPLHDGDFDSTYKNSVNATGNLYVCGNTGGNPILYQVPVALGLFGTVTALTPVANAITPCSPVTDIANANASPGPTEWIFASAQTKGVGTACGASGCVFNFNVTPWQPSTVYTVGQEILVLNPSGNLQIEVVYTTSGTGKSGAAEPAWTATAGDVIADGKVHWLNQMPLSAFTPAAWAANTKYASGGVILDPNGNIELDTAAGTKTSGGTIPTFSTVPHVITIDASVRWRNLGAIGTAALPTAGGTSGIIVDNTVSSGGGSQVYFTTLGSQACTGGTGVCAVQASQSALK